MFNLDLIIFAKSIKHRNFCVAGKNKINNEWVRPVSSPNGDALTSNQCKIQNRHGIFELKPLQIATFSFECQVPILGQSENYLINDSFVLQQKFKIGFTDIKQYLDHPQMLWKNSLDYITHEILKKENINNSLYLVEVSDLKLYVNNSDKRRANFIYNGIKYDLAVTDPNFDSIIKEVGNVYSQGFLCVSLGEYFNDKHYKLVASIFIDKNLGTFYNINKNIGIIYANAEDIDF